MAGYSPQGTRKVGWSRARLPFPVALLSLSLLLAGPAAGGERLRAREMGIVPGTMAAGPLNAITDVAGVLVGHETIVEGDRVRTGVTAVLPHGGDLFRDRVRAAAIVGNGYGKLVGYTQIEELGEIETPIILTNTLSVWDAARSVAALMLDSAGMDEVRSINPVVGETNDGYLLNDIRSFAVTAEHVTRAISSAGGGAVEEGSVGAGTGTVAFGWKGGVGTSSRVTREGGWTVGVLVQSNFGGDLMILGVPVGRELGRDGITSGRDEKDQRGSIMIILATDAPLEARNLERLARRALMGLARTGSFASNGSGDYVIAFSTARAREAGAPGAGEGPSVPNDEMTPLFQAAVEATEEAIYNSMLMARTVTGCGGTVEALPLDEVRGILQRHGMIR